MVNRLWENMVSEDGAHSRSHKQRADLLQLQARAIGIPLTQQRTDDASYEAKFKRAILNLKEKGIRGGVFGDIDFNAHREWIERVCHEIAITPHLPLWEQSHESIMADFVNLGFEAIVVVANSDFFCRYKKSVS